MGNIKDEIEMAFTIKEQCSCGGEAVFQHQDKFGNLILKCSKCGDTFDASEEWLE